MICSKYLGILTVFILLCGSVVGCTNKEDDVPKERLSRWDQAQKEINFEAGYDSAEEQFERAMNYAENGRYDLAHMHFQKALEQDPKHAGAHNGLGYTYANVMNDLNLANYHWEQALKYSSDPAITVGAHMGLGVVYCKRGLKRQEEERAGVVLGKEMRSSVEFFDLSEMHFEEVRKLSPSNKDLMFEFATLEMARGNFEAAVVKFRQYMKRQDPSDVAAIRKCYQAIALSLEAQGKMFEAITYLKQALKTFPHSPEASEAEDNNRLAIRMGIDALEKRILDGDFQK